MTTMSVRRLRALIRVRRSGAIIPAAVAAALIAGCGSSTSSKAASSSSASTAGAKTQTAVAAKMVAAASKPITRWSGFGPPVTPPANQHIVAIECSSVGVGCVQTAAGVQQADNVLGWSTTIVNGQGNPTVWNTSIEDAVANKATGIVLVDISPSLVAAGIAKAKAAGVAVVAAGNGPTADGLVLENGPQGGLDMAAYLADVPKVADALVLDDGEFPLTAQRNQTMKTELAHLCAQCRTTTVEITFGTIASKLAQQVTSALEANPSINYVVVPYDAAATFVRQGIKAAGSKAMVASFEGNPSTLTTVGDGVQAADVAAPNVWVGWQSTDDLVRLMKHQPVTNVPVPVRLFTTANKAQTHDWNGDINYEATYRRLWGKS